MPKPNMRKCPILGCKKTINPGQILCPGHWYTVPAATRDRVWSEYAKAPGSPEHLAAVRDAIRSARRIAKAAK